MDLTNIKLIATDCDGVLTDGGMYYLEDGTEMKRFNVLDGMGFTLLRQNGIKTAIITAEENRLLKRRADKLKVDYLLMGETDKLAALKKICCEMSILLEQTAYLGDDVYDVPAIEASGFGCAPYSAHEAAKAKADFITEKSGGCGCFRELVDMILKHIKEKK